MVLNSSMRLVVPACSTCLLKCKYFVEFLKHRESKKQAAHEKLNLSCLKFYKGLTRRILQAYLYFSHQPSLRWKGFFYPARK